jgi:hypothetical protein
MLGFGCEDVQGAIEGVRLLFFAASKFVKQASSKETPPAKEGGKLNITCKCTGNNIDRG